MKTLWTPWRMEHVTGEAAKVEGCLFEPPGEASHDKKHLLLFRDDSTIVLLNRYPYTNGHLLIAPVSHVSSLEKLSARESTDLMRMIKRCSTILEQVLHCDGLNIGCNIGEIAGAGIADHLHFHIVPRWKDDHNFMTVIAEIRTIPEHINRTFDKLLPHFTDLSK